jgi:hypothetical protein
VSDPYEYDVAFSFLAQDEALAVRLGDLLQDRMRVFIYSRRQGEVAGTDGEQTFTRVFGERSRLVVVLYRDGWGKSPWTRIEETAIRNRAYEHGYDFVKFIPLTESPHLPEWLPRTQLWIGLSRWGIEGAATVIEARLQELGTEPHPETVEARAARLERQLQFEAQRKRFLNSAAGVEAVIREFETLRGALEEHIRAANAAAPSISLNLMAHGNELVVRGLRYGLGVYFHYRYSNTLDDGHVEVSLWTAHPPFEGIRYAIEKPKRVAHLRFTLDLLPERQVAWVSADVPDRTFTSDALAAFIVSFYMDHGHQK